MVPLRELLQSRFGSDLPVGSGSTKKDDPLVITDQRDYVSIEYGIATFLLEEMGLEYKFERQLSHSHDGRMVDELVYAAKEPADHEWTQTRRFFFDITAGFKKIGTSTSELQDQTASYRDASGHSSFSSECDRHIKSGEPRAVSRSVLIHPLGYKLSSVRFALAAALLLVSALLHMFYIDYVTGADDPNTRGFLLSWPASQTQRAAYIDNLALPKTRPDRTKIVQTPTDEQISNLRWDHMFQYCTWRGRGRKGVSELDFSGMKCSKEFVPPPINRKSVTIPGVSLEQARSEVNADLDGRSIRYGIIPSIDTAGNKEPNRSAMEKSYWLGIIIPAVLIALSLALLFGFKASLTNHRGR